MPETDFSKRLSRPLPSVMPAGARIDTEDRFALPPNAQPKSGNDQYAGRGGPIAAFQRHGAKGGSLRPGHFQVPARQLTSQAYGRAVPRDAYRQLRWRDDGGPWSTVKSREP
jgi:hypothetical protein